MKFVKAVYCVGVRGWYVRFGPQHGVDCMISCKSEAGAKLRERLINQSLNRELKARGYRRVKLK